MIPTILGDKWEKPLEKWLNQYDGQLPEEIVSKCSEDQCAVSENQLKLLLDIGKNDLIHEDCKN